jgi:hypothetical protein
MIRSQSGTSCDLTAQGSYLRYALASEYLQSPRAALLVKWGEEFHLVNVGSSSDTVVHGRGVDVFRTRRRGAYMQSRGRFLHLESRKKAQVDMTRNAQRPDQISDRGP